MYEIASRVSLTVLVDVVDTAIYLIKRGPSSALDSGIPEKAWTCKEVNYSFLRTFGCEAFVHIDRENRTKLEDKSKKCTFIGYIIDDFSYRLWDYENHKSIGVEMWYSMKSSCIKISCKERNKKRKTKNTQCLMKSKKMNFQRHQKIKRSNRYLILL